MFKLFFLIKLYSWKFEIDGIRREAFFIHAHSIKSFYWMTFTVVLCLRH